MKQADLLELFKKGIKGCLYINYCGTFWLFVSCSFNFFSYEDSENTEYPGDPGPADGEDIQTE